MNEALTLSTEARTAAGILLLTIMAVEFGGLFMLKIVRGDQPATPLQTSLFRAGHAHAGVLVILSLVSMIYVDASHLSGLWSLLARDCIPLAAILMPAGYFLAAAGRRVTKPNRFIILLYIGAASLAIGVLSLGIGLLTASS